MAAASSLAGSIGIEWCDELRDVLRKKQAGPGECICVMNGVVKENGGEVGLDAFEGAKCLREELSFQDAIEFLRGHLQSLDDSFLTRNHNYATYLNFLIAEDLREMMKFEEAEDVYKSILEKARRHRGKKTQMQCAVESLALACLCRTSWDRKANADTEKYFKEVRKALKKIPRHSADSIERNYIIEAFAIYGEICFLKGMNEEAERCFEKALHYARLEGKESEFYILTFLYQNECSKDTAELKISLTERSLGCTIHEILHQGKLADVRRFVRTLFLYENICRAKNNNITVKAWSILPPNFLFHILPGNLQKNVSIVSLLMCYLYFRGKKEFSVYKEMVEQKLSETVVDELMKESSDDTDIFLTHINLAFVQLSMRHYEDAESHLNLAMEILSQRSKYEIEKLSVLNHYLFCLYYLWRGNMEKARSFCTKQLKLFQEHLPDKMENAIKISECLLDSMKLRSLEK